MLIVTTGTIVVLSIFWLYHVIGENMDVSSWRSTL